jgi:hypothetical protein
MTTTIAIGIATIAALATGFCLLAYDMWAHVTTRRPLRARTWAVAGTLLVALDIALMVGAWTA